MVLALPVVYKENMTCLVYGEVPLHILSINALV